MNFSEDFMNFVFEDNFMKIERISVNLSSFIWDSANKVLEETKKKISEKYENLSRKMECFDLTMEQVKKIDGNCPDLEEIQQDLIVQSKYFYLLSPQEMEIFIDKMEKSEDFPMQKMCQNIVGILHGKKNLPTWSRTKVIFSRPDFLQQFFYFPNVLEKSKYQRNKRILKYLEISPKILLQPTPLIPKNPEQLSHNILRWYWTLQKYYIIQDHNYCVYEQCVLESEIEAIEEDTLYLHE